MKTRGIPATVWALGFVSLLMDVSSEMIHSLLPLFLVTALGASVTRVGAIEGAAEATAQIVKIFSGALSDWLRNRKALALLGYGLGAASKPLFAIATSIDAIFAARMIDRVGKGIRGAPRDALIADVTPPETRGAAFGLRQSLDTVGALLGPALAMVLMAALNGNFRAVFWIATLPGLMAVMLLGGAVREPKSTGAGPQAPALHWKEAVRLPGTFWRIAALGGLMSLARFSEAFLLLRGQSAGIGNAFTPMLMVIMNAVYFLTAYPAGRLSDRLGRRGMLMAGAGGLMLSDLILAKGSGLWMIALGAGLWGLQMGLTQGVFGAWIAAHSPADRRGTAFGVFNLMGGVATMVASVAAGKIWDLYGPAITFITGAIIATAALLFAAVTKEGKTPDATDPAHS